MAGKLEAARNMLSECTDITIVTELTGLLSNELEKLKHISILVTQKCEESENLLLCELSDFSVFLDLFYQKSECLNEFISIIPLTTLCLR